MSDFKFEFDASELRSLAIHMKAAPKYVERQADEMLRQEVTQAMHESQAVAPVVTGRLAGADGLEVVQKYPGTYSIVSKYRHVYNWEYGNSTQIGAGVITANMAAAGNRYNNRALKMLVKATI